MTSLHLTSLPTVETPLTINDPAFNLAQRYVHACAVESTLQLRVHQYGLKEARRMQDEDESVDLDWLEIDPEDGRTNTLAPATAGNDK